jgi:Protein of unknown function (DUF2442)
MPKFKWYRPGDPIPPLTKEMYRKGVASAKGDEPHDVVAARYDRKNDTLDLTLRKGITVCLPRKQIWEIAHADPKDVAQVEVEPDGEGISFRSINMDIYVPGLLADELGSIVARALGRHTRGISTPKKAAASRKNGRKGGRPRKKAA